MKDIGMEYQTIDACPNDCMIYYGEGKVYLKQCPKCKISRYHIDQVTKNMHPRRFFIISPSFHIFNNCLGART
jgi:hypothetical protein